MKKLTTLNKLNMQPKELAKEFYFRDVQDSEYRDRFLKELAVRVVQDRRPEGYHCAYCRKFSTKPVAFAIDDQAIYAKNEIWVVNSHYDGCRGWD